MGTMFGIMPLFIGIMFVIVIGIIIVCAVKGTAEWSSNNHSPLQTVTAVVDTKRQSVVHHNNAGMENIPASISTSHYVTFQLQSGERMEFHVTGVQYGMLAEGDCGTLTYQGTRYQGFVRDAVL